MEADEQGDWDSPERALARAQVYLRLAFGFGPKPEKTEIETVFLGCFFPWDFEVWRLGSGVWGEPLRGLE